MRLPLRRPLRTGMIAISLLGLPMLALGFEPVLAAAMVGAFIGGVGTEIFGLGWNLAMQENVPDEMLSRAYSYDALGSFVAIPVGQLLFGPLGHAFGVQAVMLISGVALHRDRVADAAVAVRAGPASGDGGRQHHFSASALTTVRLRLVATPRSFSTWTLVSLASDP